MTASPSRAASSPAFDWLMGILAAALMGGVLVDGWAHTHNQVDQSFLTPWHALLYGSMALNGIALFVKGIAGLRRGFGFRAALPYGYWTAALGVVVFFAGGLLDGLWHTAFGIESGIVLLISPPHLVLALAGAAIMSGPLRSVAAQYGPAVRGWRELGPAVLATWSLTTVVGFFLAYSQPLEDGFTPLTMRPNASTVYPMLYRALSAGTFERVSFPARLDLSAIDLSPDGTRIAYRVNRYHDANALPPSSVYVADLDGSRATRIPGDADRHDTEPAFAPDGKSLAYVSMPAGTSGDFRILVVRLDDPKPRVALEQPTTIGRLAWSPDGKYIAFASRRGTVDEIAVLDPATGAARWLSATADGASPFWTRAGLYYANDSGAIRVHVQGSADRTVIARADGFPAVARDGHIAYMQSDLGSEQAFVARPGGGSARDVSQLSGLDVQDLAWSPDGSLYVLAQGRESPLNTDLGKSLAMGAILLQALLVTGAVLTLLHRWVPPLGAVTLVLTAFALAMALQSDFYVYALGAFATGAIADVALAVRGERLRRGMPFYAFATALPLLFTTAFEIVTSVTFGGNGWSWNLLLGAPALAGIAGLLLAFCFESPLEAGTDDRTRRAGRELLDRIP
ncbi:MAG TPA: LpqB family beta-propeller domain-containing protein [Candidatus Acidoferrales bacterium]|nr:LpqB family beta-propeller domain-containing protein [Candidatus Acidoferrales bacterium]